MLTLDAKRHAGWVLRECGDCSRCCDGSLFTAGLVPLADFAATARHFPIVFYRIGADFLPAMLYALKPGRPCPYLDAAARRCRIYDDGRPLGCVHFPFRLFLKEKPSDPPFPGLPAHLEMDERCPSLGQGDENDQNALPLLDTTGQPTDQFLNNLPLPDETAALEKTRRFCQWLDMLNLLQKREMKTGRKKPKKIKFWQVDPKRLTDLPPYEQKKLVKINYLKPIQDHLDSLERFDLFKK